MKRFVLFLALLAVVPASSALAVAPSTMSYQGVLTDAGGNLVPDGNYTLTFRIYNVSVAGAALYTEVHPGVPVTLGGFSVIIGSITPISLPFDVQYWLGVQVFANPELLPRVQLASSPYGLSLRLPFAGSASSTGPVLHLTNTGSGTEIQVGSPTNNGEIQVFGSGTATRMLEIQTTSSGGQIYGYDEAGARTFDLEQDTSPGGGGIIDIRRNDTGTNGFSLNGNWASTNEPRMFITGSSQSATFNMDLTGNATVSLPADAISAPEMLDEAGAASAVGSSLSLDGTLQTILSRTITVPTAGYVLVMASAQANALHSNGTTDNASFGVSDVSTSLPINQDVGFLVNSTYPTGNLLVPITVHGLFEVSTGANTFYFLGREISGSLSVNDMQLTCVFMPTAYGTVTSTIPNLSVSSADDDLYGPQRGLTPGEIEAERTASVEFNAARIQREIDAMRADLEKLQREIEAERQSASVDE